MSRAPRPFLTRRTAPRIAALEARIMFDAAAVAQAIDMGAGERLTVEATPDVVVVGNPARIVRRLTSAETP